LAQLIGSTRQRVNQILQHWVSAGIVRHHYGHIVLLDLTKLQAIEVGGRAVGSLRHRTPTSAVRKERS
jgi:hypothetical protein